MKSGFHYRHSSLGSRLPGTAQWSQHYCFSRSPENLHLWRLLPEGESVGGTAATAEWAGEEVASLSSSPCSPYVSDTLESNGSSKPILRSCVLSGWVLPSSFLCFSPFCGSRGPALHLGSSKYQFSLCCCEVLERRPSSSFLLY